jgi:hypothetical protein
MSSVGPTGNGVTGTGQATASQDLPPDQQQEANQHFATRPGLVSQTSSTTSQEEDGEPHGAKEVFNTCRVLLEGLVDELDYLVQLKEAPEVIKAQDALLKKHWVPYHVAATTYVATLPLAEANQLRHNSVRLGDHIEARRKAAMTYRKAARTYSKSAKARLEAMERAVKAIEFGGTTSSSIVIPCVPPPHPILSLYAQSTSFVTHDHNSTLVGPAFRTAREHSSGQQDLSRQESNKVFKNAGGRRDPAPDLKLQQVTLGPSGILQPALVGLDKPGGRIAHAPDLVLVTPPALVRLEDTEGRRAAAHTCAAPDLVCVTQLELQQVIATVTSGILQPALVGLEEPGGRIAHAPDLDLITPLALVGLGESGGRRGHAPDLVLVTPLALGLVGLEKPGGRIAPAPNLALVAQLDLVGLGDTGGRRAAAHTCAAPDLVVATITGGARAAAPDLVLVTRLGLLLGVEGPGGRRVPAPDLELQQDTRGRRADAPDLVLVTRLVLLRGVEEPGGRRDPAPDLVLVTRLELLLGVEEPGGSRAVAHTCAAPDLVLVTPLALVGFAPDNCLTVACSKSVKKVMAIVNRSSRFKRSRGSIVSRVQTGLSSCQVKDPYYKILKLPHF